MSDKNLTINITSGTILKSVLIVLLFASLYYLRDLVLVILTAVVLASSVEPATVWFSRRKVPRVVSVILVYGIIIFIVTGTLFVLVPPLLDEISGILSSSPQYLDSIKLWTPVGDLPSTFSLKEIITEFRQSLTTATGSVLKTFSMIFGGVLNFILVVVLSFYLAVQENGVANFLRIISPVDKEKYIIGLWKRTQAKIGLWMQGQILLALIIGVLAFLGLNILGIKFAFLLAVLAAATELIPIFGPIIAAIPAIILGLISGGPTLALMVAGFYIIIQQFENHLIYPLVVKKVVGVPPLLVILALIIGAKLAGFLGMILSVPLATAIMELVSDIEEKKKKNAVEVI